MQAGRWLSIRSAMTIGIYDKGDLVRISGAFTLAGVALDPTTVTLKVKDPSGNVDTYTYALAQVTKASTGNYYKDVSIDEAGYWWYQWTGTGAVESVDEDYLVVRSRQVGT